jgi:pSer/pThr/pTyr-binding forkhead associated (FHA) protein
MRCWLRLGGHEVEVKTGQTVLGRHDSCHLVLDDPLASRRHAQVDFDGEQVVISDLGSVNGVLINGRRIKGSQQLQHGDELRIGGQVLQLHLSSSANSVPARHRQGAQTLSASDAAQLMQREADEATAVRDGEALETLALVADKMLTMGRAADAERIVRGALRDLAARQARGQQAERARLELAATLAVRLAEGTLKGEWITYAFDVFCAADQVLPAAVIDHLYSVVRVVDRVELGAVRKYTAQLRQRETALGPAERFLLRRLEGFERLAELR